METITKALESAPALSAVAFVYDYIQLGFKDLQLSVYSALSIRSTDGVLHRENLGYCDKLVGLIGQRAISAKLAPRLSLDIAFEAGDTLLISLRASDVTGPEFFQLDRPGLPTIVEQVP